MKVNPAVFLNTFSPIERRDMAERIAMLETEIAALRDKLAESKCETRRHRISLRNAIRRNVQLMKCQDEKHEKIVNALRLQRDNQLAQTKQLRVMLDDSMQLLNISCTVSKNLWSSKCVQE